jgi:hypothetical protein
MGGMGGGGGYGDRPPPRDRFERAPRIQLPYAPAPTEAEGNTTVFIGSIPEDTTEIEIFQIFCTVGPVSSVSVPRGKGCAFVQYQFKGQAEQAIRQMNGLLLRGSPLRCTFGKNQMRIQPQAVPAGQALGAMAGPGGYMQMGQPPFGMQGGSSAGQGVGGPVAPRQAGPARAGAQAQAGQSGSMDVEEAAAGANAIPAELSAAFGSYSVRDGGEMLKPLEASHANTAFGYTQLAVMGIAGAGLAWPVQAAEAGTVMRA